VQPYFGSCPTLIGKELIHFCHYSRQMHVAAVENGFLKVQGARVMYKEASGIVNLFGEMET